MCIIVFKPKNKLIPSIETLRECFKNNPHGAGFMYSDGQNVIVQKGFMEFNHLIDALKQIPDVKKLNLIIHFRLSTHGAITPANCHPFPLTGDKKELQKLQNVCPSAIVHNGILYQYGQKNTVLSDTAFFAKLLSGLPSKKAVARAVKAHNPNDTQRFIVMFADGEIVRNGYFNKYHGCFFSNYSYKPKEIIEIPDGILSEWNYQKERIKTLQLLDGETGKKHQLKCRVIHAGSIDDENIDDEQRKFISYLNAP